MILGSHNSFTYLKPRTWYGWLIRFTAKCQRASIREQYEKYGVRAFDIRVKMSKNGSAVLAHGLVEYKGSQEALNEALDFLDKKGNAVAKVSLELRAPWQEDARQEEWFKKFCKQIEGEYGRIRFYGGKISGSGKRVYTFGNKDMSADGFHASWATKTKLDDLWPYWYAKKNNKNFYRVGSKKDIMFLDFVDIQ